MGAGKSSVGQALAERLGWRFTDLDSYVEHKAGKSVARIFAEDGEGVFRALEAEAVRDRIIMSEVEGFDLVLALGGGTLTINSVRPLILSRTRCIWLKVSPQTALERIGGSKERPLLTEDPSKLLEERLAIYSLAPESIGTDGKTVEEIVNLCYKQL